MKADRAFTRSAIHSEHLNISIRAVTGERNSSDHRRSQKICSLWFNSAIEMLAIGYMRSAEIVKTVTEHIRRHGSLSTVWFSGIRWKARVHQWDEGELPFSTACWIALQADSPIEARNAVEQLVELGLTQTHGGDASADAAQVFAYALN